MGRQRWVVLGVVATVVVAAAGVAATLWLYPSEFVWRAVAWGDSDVGDQDRFARRDVAHRPGASDPVSTPDPARVRRAFAAATGGAELDPWMADRGTLALVILQDGRVVYEAYHGGQTRERPVTSFSVAKSILSTLIIAAVSDGLIPSLDEPVTTFLPELAARDPRFARITLRHLLQMHSGIAYRETRFLNGDDAKTYYWPDLRELALRRTRIDTDPGGPFLYNNYHPLLLGLVLERVTRMPVAEYLARRLWQPAGLGPGASWSLDHEGGFEKLESGVNARAIDFARFGQLFLDAGVATDGRRVLPASWVEAATAPAGALSLASRRPGAYYNLFWWGQQRSDGAYDFSARGNHGQFVHVSPAHRVVIARFGSRYDVPPTEWVPLLERFAAALGERRTP
jgi:CubicO group peptidase (beta-lactamase class C family)